MQEIALLGSCVLIVYNNSRNPESSLNFTVVTDVHVNVQLDCSFIDNNLDHNNPESK